MILLPSSIDHPAVANSGRTASRIYFPSNRFIIMQLAPTLLHEIKSIWLSARHRAYSQVNRTLIDAYWQIGQRIVLEEQKGKDRARYGAFLLRELADAAYPSEEGIRRYARPVAGGLHLSICAWNYPTAMIGYLVTSPLAAGTSAPRTERPRLTVRPALNARRSDVWA